MWFITMAAAEAAHGAAGHGAAGHGDAAHGAGGHASSSFPPFDSTYFAPQLFWLAVTFGLLYWLMSRIALPRIADIISTRQHRIEGDIAAARADHDAAYVAEAAEAKKLAQARASAQATAQAAYEKLKEEADAARKDLESDLHAKIAAAEVKIAEARAKAMGNVNQIVAETAQGIFEQLTGAKPDPQRLSAAVAQVVKG